MCSPFTATPLPRMRNTYMLGCPHDPEEIVRSVQQAACREVASWPVPTRLPVNETPIQFQLVDMVAEVQTALSLSGLPAERLDIEIFSVSSSDLPASRTRLLQQAIAWQARYALWLDTDHVFPPDALLRLLRHKLPVVMVVGNNSAWGLEKQPMQMLYGYDVAADLAPQTRYDEVVRALGGAGETITDPREIGPALDRAFAANVPYLVNVITDVNAPYPRNTFGI